MTKPYYIKRFASIHPADKPAGQPFLSADEPDYKPIIPNPGIRRRMSRIIKMGVAAALQCINNETQPEAIITATGLGCLADTEKFMAQLLDNNEQLLNPTAFIQSTFNTIGAQIALLQKLEVYNTTYVHRSHSFENALSDAKMLLDEGRHDILVGAIDEIYETPRQIKQRLGLLNNITPGEGAQFFLLDNDPAQSIAAIHAVEYCTAPPSVPHFLETALQKQGWDHNQIDIWMTGENGNEQHDAIYRTILPQSSRARHIPFKRQCGEYPTAIAYAVGTAAREIHTGKANKIVIYNHLYDCHSIILISNIP